MAMFPLCVVVAEMAMWEVQGSLWSLCGGGSLGAKLIGQRRWARGRQVIELHSWLLAGSREAWILLVVESIVVAGSALLLLACVRKLLYGRATIEDSRSTSEVEPEISLASPKGFEPMLPPGTGGVLGH